MLGAIYIGLSGMNAYSQGLQTISNNVANMNSPGFKATSVSFTDMFAYGGGGLTYTGGTDTQHAGSGVRFGSPHIDFGQGDLRQSSNDLDLAIQGSGFLVLLDGEKTFYARTGQFVVAEDGYIVQQGTEYRLGVLDSAGKAVAVNINAKRTSEPTVTTKIKFADNLSIGSTEAIVSDMAVYDSRGGKQVWKAKFTPIGSTAPGSWQVLITDQTGAEVATKTIKFLGNDIDPTTAQVTVTDTPDGAAALSVVLDFTDVSSFSGGSASTIRAASVDGNGVGALTTIKLDEDGKLEMTYSNTKTESLGAVALADFRDPQKLERIGDGLFELRGSSEYRLTSSGTDGIGKLVSKQIEASNVDLSQEFGDLILIQRGFQASSQVVSVTNDMIQQLFGIRGQG